jgi:hypothetical protein
MNFGKLTGKISFLTDLITESRGFFFMDVSAACAKAFLTKNVKASGEVKSSGEKYAVFRVKKSLEECADG